MSDEEYTAEGEATNPTDEDTVELVDEGQTDGEQENTEALKERLARLEDEKRHLLARAKKAEADSKKKRTDLTTPDVPSSESVDERILKSQGMSDELLKELKRVARFNETDLITAQKDPMFVSIKERYEQAERDREAQLGASKGSGATKPKKGFTTPNLTPDEHKALWQKQMRG